MAKTVTRRDIVAGLARLGIAPGDALLVHSRLSRFGHVEGGADAVTDALLEAVGPEGTVAVPTHTWGTVHALSPVFDVRHSPSIVGRITETLRKRSGAVRGLHPTHSCAAIGPLAAELSRHHEKQVTPCGSKSPYQRLMECGGKIVFLGVTLSVNTSFHALEEIACVPWLFDHFELLYTIDAGGRKWPVPSRRHRAGLSRAYEEMEPLLAGHGALARGRIGEAPVRVVDAQRMRDAIVPMLARDPFLPLAEPGATRERARYKAWREERAR